MFVGITAQQNTRRYKLKVRSKEQFKGTAQFSVIGFFNISSLRCKAFICDATSHAFQIKKAIIILTSQSLLVSVDGGRLLFLLHIAMEVCFQFWLTSNTLQEQQNVAKCRKGIRVSWVR